MDGKRNVVLLTAALVFTMSIVICLHNISIQSSVAQPSRYNTSKSQNQTSTIIGGGVTSHAITRIHPIVTERIGTITTVPQFAERNGIAFCHPDEVVVGGGYLIGAGGFPGAAGGQEITASERSEDLRPPQPNGWVVAMENNGGINGGSADFAAKAECLKLQ